MDGNKTASHIGRHKLREGAFVLYFERLLRDDEIDDIYEVNLLAKSENDEIEISEQSCELAKNVEQKQDELDEIINLYSPKRSVGRIPKINLAILRLALYEANYSEAVPLNVAISEAVALAQKYARKPDVAFINGVLGAYSRSVNSKDEPQE
ncbi:MAG: transcription antitermination factor NusB [Ruminococcus sp.]|nr:transcription antitermination factor NusB [Ruminococcus sp.]